MSERIQKILSQAGVASRREAEKMIRAGRVRVNDAVVTQLGSSADPGRDRIVVDGKPLLGEAKKAYYLFHKPVNVMVTRHDPEGRPTIYDYLKGIPERVNYVGRLDFDSEGLVLLTNDGALHAHLTHPRHEVPKLYRVKVATQCGAPLRIEEVLGSLQKGVDIGDARTRPAEAKVLKQNPRNAWIEITLKEGKNRQIRRMIEALGGKVLRLVRIGIGPIRLGELEKGRWRRLTPREIVRLKGSVPGTRS